jgi:uncharacterized protein (DUF433 family)
MMPYERIELDRRVCNGKPIIKGTRMPVVVFLERISEGDPWEKILADYPELTREDIQAALLYARVSLEHAKFKTINA